MKLRQARKIIKACVTPRTNWHLRLFVSMNHLSADQRIEAARRRCLHDGWRNGPDLCLDFDSETHSMASFLAKSVKEHPELFLL